MQRPHGRREQADVVGSEMQPCVIGGQSLRGEMDQADAVELVTGQIGQDHVDLVGDFNLYLKSKGKPLADLNRGVT